MLKRSGSKKGGRGSSGGLLSTARRRGAASAAAVLVVSLAASSPAGAATAPEAPVLTQQTVRVGDRTLAYAAEVGRIPIRDVETGEPHGFMGYIAYRVRTKGPPRPLTFVWNGGPGADSSTLHFEVVGPKRGEGAGLVDNAETWLADTDLVFVDPIGTGFSRPARAEYAQEFYSTVGDVASVAEFVRSWRLLHGAEDAPIFLAGESWGAGRAGSVGYALLKRGVPVKGLVLISGGSGLPAAYGAPELLAALRVADLAPVALFHGRLPPELGRDADAARRNAAAWARETYAPALARAASLSEDERSRIVGELSRRTGMPADQIDRKTLAFGPRAYRTALLGEPAKVLNVFDMRKVADPPRAFNPAILRYLRGALAYHTDLPYLGVEGLRDGFAPGGKPPEGPGARWDYATAPVSEAERAAAMQAAMASGSGPPRLGPPLPSTAEAVALNPDLKVLVAAGSFDSLNSCSSNGEVARNLPTPLKGAVTFKCYEGGHMFYRDQPSRLAFSRDIRALLDAAK
ncbi:MAG: peptidase S10 [Phenylobacterium sp.]|uniref:S10 family serine carboxypeptidase-like protein n=1 Tax=Phenylobacterium sp. TaxID=1871053 RepID=UPI0011FC23A9|nr:peptidase S10 [Phenylobacterium sp.]TAJ71987.1 MAG: peptidase S10 [Phenylobacterium sp.]